MSFVEKIYSNENMIVSMNRALFLELEELISVSNIKEYIERIESFKMVNAYNDTIILKRIMDILDRDIFNIYVYLGAYYDYSYIKDDDLCYDKRDSDYLLFKTLLSYHDVYKLSYEEDYNFEKDKIIVKFRDSDFNSFDKYDEKYQLLRTFYFKCLLNGLTKEEFLEEIINNKEKFGIKEVSAPNKVKIKKYER